METMFGIGMMVGPFIGGVLYEVGGFYFPFIVCGGSLVACTGLAAIMLTTDDETSDDIVTGCTETPTVFRQLLKTPSIPLSCIVLVLAEASVTWYLPSLQPFLEENFHLSPLTTGAMFMVEGATYAAFSPLWGYLLDKSVGPHMALVFGCISVMVGFCFLGPAPFLPFLPKNIYLVAVGLFIQGSGVAAIFITTLVFMLSESVANGAADSDQTRGMITALWFISENIGGFLGSSLGGLTYDTMGFENSTLVVIGLQMIALVCVAIMAKLHKRGGVQRVQSPVIVVRQMSSRPLIKETERLLPPSTSYQG
jgi:predicted MFS family arabinose efflux permease